MTDTPPPIGERRFLALYRAGPNSIHPITTVDIANQNWDYALSWYGAEHPDTLGMANGAAFVDMAPQPNGAQGLLQTIPKFWEEISRYDYVWLPDDDLLCDGDDISRLFEHCAALQTDLAQPALARESFFAHVITVHHPEFQVRWTNFVEAMAPVFSLKMLERILPTLNDAGSGWALDSVWPHHTRIGKMAIIDDVTIVHTRPLGQGNGYADTKTATIDAAKMLARYGTRSAEAVNYAGLLHSGDVVSIGGRDEEAVSAFLDHIVESLKDRALLSFYYADYLAAHVNFAKAEPTNRLLLNSLLNESISHLGVRLPENDLATMRRDDYNLGDSQGPRSSA